jgi:PAS domain S-box-containing protein
MFGLGSIYVFNRTSQSLDIIRKTTEDHRLLSRLKMSFTSLTATVKDWAFTAEKRDMRKYREGIEIVTEDLDALRNSIKDNDALKEINRDIEEIMGLAEIIMKCKNPQENPDVIVTVRRFENLERKTLTDLETLNSSSIRNLDSVVDESEELKFKLTFYVSFIMLLTLGLVIFLVVLIIRSVDRPFKRLLDRITRGDLEAISADRRGDEFGIIADQYGHLLNKLKVSESSLKKRLSEAEMLFEVTTIASSTLELKDSLRMIASTIAYRMKRDYVGVYLFNVESQKLHLQASNRNDGIFKDSFDESEGGLCRKMMEDLNPIYREAPDSREVPFIIGVVGSILMFPLLRDSEFFGLLFIGSKEKKKFTEDEMNVVNILANTIGTVGRNAELYASTINQLKEITILYKLSNALTTLLDLDKLLKRVTYEVTRLLNARGCIIRLREGELLKIKAYYGVSDDLIKHMEIRVGEGIVGKVAETGKPSLIEDVLQMPMDMRIPYMEVKSVICAPLKIGDEIIGTIGLYDKKTPDGDIVPFSYYDLKTIRGFASIISLAIEKSRLFEIHVQKEREALEAKKRLDILFESVHGGIVTLDRDYRILSVNRYVEDLLNVKAEEIHLSDALEVFHRRKGICPHCVAQITFDTGEINVITQTHGPVYAELSSYPIKDNKGNVVEAVVFIQDVTDRVQYQEEILSLYKEVAQTKEYLESLIANSEDAIVTTDLMGVVKSWNKGAEKIYGFSEKEALGKFLPFIPESLIETEKKYIEKIKKGETIKDIETVRQKKNGVIIEVSLTLSPIKDASGEVMGISSISRDISEKKKFENELIRKNKELSRLFEKIRLAEMELENIFESLSDMLYITNEDCVIRNINMAVVERVGKRKEEIIGRKCYEIFHGMDRPYEKCPHTKTVTNKMSYIEEYDDPYFGGTFLASSSPLFDASGKFIGTVHVVRDVSELKELREKLAMTERMAALGEMAAKVAHEIRNPLVSIGGFSRRLEKRLDGKLQEYASIITREVSRLEEILRDTLSFVKQVKLSKESVEIVDIINETISLFSQEIKQKGINLQTDLKGAFRLEVDPNRIKEALINIISNAIQILKEGDTLIINTYSSGGYGIIEIKDTGCGIKEKDLPFIFDPFYTTKTEGTGLGLAIAHRVIEEHHGKIKVYSRIDKGTTFKVYLPLNGEKQGGS